MGTARRSFGWTVLCGALLAACTSSPAADPPASSTTLPATTTTIALSRYAAYLEEMIDLIVTEGYWGERVAAAGWRERIVARDAESPIPQWEMTQLFGSIRNDLADHHSNRFPPGEVATLTRQMSGPVLTTPAPSGAVTDGIGTLALPGVLAFAESGAYAQYVAAAHAVLQQPACGWVLDLRGNGGGSPLPMLAAVAPLLGPGTFLGYVDRAGEVSGFQTADTSATELDTAPVAILTDGETASAAEGVLVAFIGRVLTRSFGAPTKGVPTKNTPFTLSDGGVLNLTTAISVDRLGATHEGPITPDVVVAADQALAEATAWLGQQPACQAARP